MSVVARPRRHAHVANLVATLAACASVLAPADAQSTARVDVVLRSNGRAATGSWEARRADGTVAARGRASGGGRVPPGTYTIVVAIDGVLDRPTRTFSVVVGAQRGARVESDFATGTLTATVTRGGRPAAAMIEILRDGAQVARLTAGVRATLSAGSYVLRARHRGETREVPAVVPAGSDATAELAF